MRPLLRESKAIPVLADHPVPKVSQVLADLALLGLLGLGGLLAVEILDYLDRWDLPARREKRSWGRRDRRVRRAQQSWVRKEDREWMEQMGWTVDQVSLDDEDRVVPQEKPSWDPPDPQEKRSSDPPVPLVVKARKVRSGRPAHSVERDST